MNFFAYRLKRRKFRNEVLRRKHDLLNQPSSFSEEELKQLKIAHVRAERNLLYLETIRLQMASDRFALTPPNFGPGWQLDIHGERWYLDERSIAEGKRLVSKTRLEWWKSRIEVFAPIIAILISLLALFISIASYTR